MASNEPGRYRPAIPPTFGNSLSRPLDRPEAEGSFRRYVLEELEQIERALEQTAFCLASPPGGSAAADLTGVSGEPINGSTVVLTDGGLFTVDNTILSHGCQVLGVAVTAATASGQAVTVRTFGVLADPSFNFSVGDPVFVGPNGQLTQNATPAPGQLWLRQVGHATAPDALFIRLGPTVNLC